ncbi:MAG: ribonuclease E activity regulator RraA [Burkholderiaceae bacterium]|jgi:regulator of ribonuclease activity A
MPKFATTDLCDAHEALLVDGRIRILPPGLLHFGQHFQVAGPACTLQVFEDNARVRSLLENSGDGRVLVVDGAASLRCALVGGNLAALGARNGWAGILVHGCVRDADELDQAALGIWALALNPRRAAKEGKGETQIPVRLGEVDINPGEWIYADRDGVLVSADPLI